MTVPVTNGTAAATGYAEWIMSGRTFTGIVDLAASGTTVNVRDNITRQIWSNTIPKAPVEDDLFFLTIRYSTT